MLSTKGRYGSRAVIDLAECYGSKNVQLKDIARRQRLSVKYLEQIMTTLSSKGIVHGHRGKNGGYSLVSAPRDIKLSEVVLLLEGSVSPTRCADDPRSCEYSDKCVMFMVWSKVKQAVMNVLDSYTIADLVRQDRKIRKNHHKKL